MRPGFPYTSTFLLIMVIYTLPTMIAGTLFPRDSGPYFALLPVFLVCATSISWIQVFVVAHFYPSWTLLPLYGFALNCIIGLSLIMRFTPPGSTLVLHPALSLPFIFSSFFPADDWFKSIVFDASRALSSAASCTVDEEALLCAPSQEQIYDMTSTDVIEPVAPKDSCDDGPPLPVPAAPPKQPDNDPPPATTSIPWTDTNKTSTTKECPWCTRVATATDAVRPTLA